MQSCDPELGNSGIFFMLSGEDGGFQDMLRIKSKGCGGKIDKGKDMNVKYFNISGGILIIGIQSL